MLAKPVPREPLFVLIAQVTQLFKLCRCDAPLNHRREEISRLIAKPAQHEGFRIEPRAPAPYATLPCVNDITFEQIMEDCVLLRAREQSG